jgi:hypothetical protein
MSSTRGLRKESDVIKLFAGKNVTLYDDLKERGHLQFDCDWQKERD